ncbi:TPA: hypothetical protein N0F65_013059 [Lagenidium giganteum]|uniref:FYVE-type domain-containing protein n=1 Tax=Lagenidium giganteum TaxID=4803 RepID=A0AAV2YPC2_9STRA|nr:TPA: hypothetical protein N0F65_013059 [Lagenidium giganteum]
MPTPASGEAAITEQQVCAEALRTLPVLQSVVAWKRQCRKHSVDSFEWSTDEFHAPPTLNKSMDPTESIAHSIVAKEVFSCHLNEMLNILTPRDPHHHQASWKALCGDKYKEGSLVFQRKRKLGPAEVAAAGGEDLPDEGLVGVQSITLRPKLSVSFSKPQLPKSQQLCFATCTFQYPPQTTPAGHTTTRAVHLMRTLPKDLHDHLVPSKDRSALRGALSHLAIGFYIESVHRPGGSANQTTRITVHAYATATTGQAAVHGAMTPEARHVLRILAKSLRQMERILRRRRFGFQTFFSLSTTSTQATTLPSFDSDLDEFEDQRFWEARRSSCGICQKRFNRFTRRTVYCELCGHGVCRECSSTYDVEVPVGLIHKRRICITCVVRVNHCVFDDEALLAGLSPIVVAADDDAWKSPRGARSSVEDEIAEKLYSDNEDDSSMALELLGQLAQVDTEATSPVRPSKRSVKHHVEQHVRAQVQSARQRFAEPLDCVVAEADGHRDYTYDFNSKQTSSPSVPLAPMPAQQKEQRRLRNISASGMLHEDYDRAGLDMIAELAAQRMNSPIGFVSVVDGQTFHAVGKHRVPEMAKTLPRNENACIYTVYAEKPLVLKNPLRDVRFSQMPLQAGLGVRFYAGFPIHAPDGSVVASLCTVDGFPRANITTQEFATMTALAKLASDLICAQQHSNRVVD